MQLTRRNFIKSSMLAGIATYSITLPIVSIARTETPIDVIKKTVWHLYLKIYPNNKVEIVSSIQDTGQHMKTTGPMILADELDADWQLVECIVDNSIFKQGERGVEYPYVNESTGGSQAVRNNWDYLRESGARAKLTLRQAAAKVWQCHVDDVRAESSFLYQDATNKRLSYGEVAHIAAALPMPTEVSLKKRNEYKIIGKSTTTVDIEQILTGKPLYPIDMELPNLLHATIERCPYFDGRVKSFDDSDAKKIPGVRAIFKQEAVAHPSGFNITAEGVVVVADTFWLALKARRALKIVWDKGPWQHESTETLLNDYKALVRSKEKGRVQREDGNVETGFQQAQQLFEAEYQTSFFAHACMEPFSAIADVTDQGCYVETGHQHPAKAAAGAALVVGCSVDDVTVKSHRSGGGFGRRYSNDFVCEAVAISKRIKHPVKVTWTREDEISQDQFAPGQVLTIKAGVDSANQLNAWHMRIAKKSGGARADSFPAGLIDNLRVETLNKKAGVKLGPWRGPDHIQFAFAAESMLDEVAHALDIDPLAYREQLFMPAREIEYPGWGATTIDTGRMMTCYREAARLSNWSKLRPKGVGLGIAGHFTFGTYCAFVVEVDARSENSIRISNAWGAIDCGLPVNPNHIKNQMEGGFIDGLNASIFNDVHISNGRVTNTNFHTLKWMKISDVPKEIESHIIQNEYPPTGVGEPPTAPAAAALANAIFTATGKRIRKLPISLEV